MGGSSMSINLKDLKKFPGNKALGGEFMFLPVDSKKLTVKDIPNLPADKVIVLGLFQQDKKPKAGKRVRPLRIKLCLVSELPDDDQLGEIATMKRNKRLLLADEGKATVTGGERLVSNLISQYVLSSKIVNKKDAWTIQQILNFWSKEIGHVLLSELKASEISAAKSLLKDRAPKTQNNYVSALCSCFNYGVKNLHWISANVVKEVAKEEVDNKIERFLSDEERVRFLEGLEASESPTLKVFGHFGLATGCRKSEALALTWSDIDFENNTITFNSAKRRKVCTGSENGKLLFNRNVIQSGLKNGSNAKVISMKNLGPLRTILLEHKLKVNSELVFPQDPRKSFETLLRNCKIDNFRFHDLRHTCASYLVQAGVELLKVAAHLGHKNIQSTLRYAHLSPKVTEETGGAVAARIYGNLA
jgi:integrase